MLTRNAQADREQIQMVTLDGLVHGTHLVRKLEMALDWSFIYGLVEPLYCEDNGRPSIDPVMLVKLAVINYMFGLNSMRRSVREVAVNNAYRWFLGLGLQDPVPHFSTAGSGGRTCSSGSSGTSSPNVCRRVWWWCSWIRPM